MSMERIPDGVTEALHEAARQLEETGYQEWSDTHQFGEIFSQGMIGDLSKAKTLVTVNGKQIEVLVRDTQSAAQLHAHIDFQPDGRPALVDGTDTRSLLRYLTDAEYSALVGDLEYLSHKTIPADINHLTP